MDWTKLGPLSCLVPYVHISDTALCLKDVCTNGSWDLRDLYTSLSPEICDAVYHTPIPATLDHRLHDTWVWGHGKQGNYTCASGYHWLLMQHRVWDPDDNFSWIWRLKVPAKVQHFVWLCIHNALPTNARRHHCNMAATPSCTRCSSNIEDILHCIRDCPHSKELWLRLGMGTHSDFFDATDAPTWIQSFTQGPPSVLFLAGLWIAWCWRNNMIFEEHPWQVHEALRKVHATHDEYITHCSGDGIDPAPLRLLAHWTPPSQGNFKLNVDGSFLNNTSVLGAGGVVRNSDGDWMFGFSHFENGGDALLAELRAMELGLELCLQRGMRRFLCESDCLEAITLVSTENINCLHSYAHTTLQITELMTKCEVDSWRHVVQETNKCADFLAKEGAHSSCSTHWDSPPPRLECLILMDTLGT